MTRRSLAPALALLTALRLVINTGQRFVYPFLPAIARGLGVSLERAGLLVSARWATGLGTPLIMSTLGRGERRRRVAGLGLALFVAGAALTAATDVYVGALFGFALMGIAKPVFDVSAQSYVADRTPYHRRARYLSVLELTWAGGLLVGAPAAGWLIDRFGWSSPFWAIAAGAALLGALLPRTLERDRSDPGAVTGRLRLGRDSIALLVAASLFTFAAEVMFVVFGAWLEDDFGLSLLALGGAATVIGLSELAGEGSTLAFTDRIGKRRSVVVGLVLSIVGFAVLATSPTGLTVALIMVGIAFFGFEFTIVSTIPLATEIVPGARSRYLAWLVVAMSLARTAGAGLGPLLFAAFGLGGNATAAVIADLASLVVLLRLVPDDREN